MASFLVTSGPERAAAIFLYLKKFALNKQESFKSGGAVPLRPVPTGLGVNDLGDPPNLLGRGQRDGPDLTTTNQKPALREGGDSRGLNNPDGQSERRRCGLRLVSSSCRGAEKSAKQEAEDCGSEKPVVARRSLGKEVSVRLGGKRSLQVDATAPVSMGKGDPNKPRGKMSSYAFFVQTCREEHKKKHPDSSVNFAEFSKKCSERWKTMSAKEKSKFEDLAKSDKARYDREMKNYVPPKGDKKGKKKDPNAPKRPPSAFFLFCSEHRPKIKSEHPGLSIGDTAKKLGEMWSEQSAKDKQPYEQKAAKLKEKYEKDIAAYRAKGKTEAGKKGPGRPTGSKKKNEPEDEEEEEEEEDEDDEEEEEDEE
ncbi:high mobility group protein B2 [Sigmodon hispidus]